MVWQTTRIPDDGTRSPRRSDSYCSYCRTAGVRTDFHFLVEVHKTPTSELDTFVIALSAVILRDFGKYSRAPSRHASCHGIGKGKLATFQESWDGIPNQAPCLVPEEASDVPSRAQTTSRETLRRSWVADRLNMPCPRHLGYAVSASREDLYTTLNRRWITENLE